MIILRVGIVGEFGEVEVNLTYPVNFGTLNQKTDVEIVLTEIPKFQSKW